MRTMLDVFPDFVTGGIFSVMINPPWLGNINNSELDFEYFTRYGSRLAGSVVLSLLGKDEKMSPENTAHIARLLQSHYKRKWEILWKTFQAEYNPIENYNMEETGKDTTVRHDEHTRQGADDLEYLGSEKINAKSQIYGFDSTTGADSDATETNTSYTGRQDNRTTSDSGSNDGNDTTDHSLTRHGNIGVTTNQQMMEQEINFRNAWNYFEIVFADVNHMLTLPIFEMEGL